jgi:tetratricopeptide (TPR) repeat protein
MKKTLLTVQLAGFCLTILFVFNSCAQKPTAKDFFNRAESEIKGQNWDSAIVSYSKAIELDNQFADAYFGWAMTYLLLKDFENSLADFNKVIFPKPF